jgi:hypothetical protein
VYGGDIIMKEYYYKSVKGWLQGCYKTDPARETARARATDIGSAWNFARLSCSAVLTFVREGASESIGASLLLSRGELATGATYVL